MGLLKALPRQVLSVSISKPFFSTTKENVPKQLHWSAISHYNLLLALLLGTSEKMLVLSSPSRSFRYPKAAHRICPFAFSSPGWSVSILPASLRRPGSNPSQWWYAPVRQELSCTGGPKSLCSYTAFMLACITGREPMHMKWLMTPFQGYFQLA